MSETIRSCKAIEILDSRGNPTIRATVLSSSGTIGVASVPSGASTGEHEAVELRDQDPKRYGGKGVLKAVDHINGPIQEEIQGRPLFNQEEIEKQKQIEQIQRETKIKEFSHVLKLGITDLEECARMDDIKKTCRALTRKIYKDPSVRSTMLVSQIPFHIIDAIRCKYHM